MNKHAFAALAALAFALPTVAQTEGQDVKSKVETEKLWKVQCSGIGG